MTKVHSFTFSAYGQIVFTMRDHKSPVFCMTLSTKQLLVSGAKNGRVFITDIILGGVVCTLRAQGNGAITAVSTVKFGR